MKLHHSLFSPQVKSYKGNCEDEKSRFAEAAAKRLIYLHKQSWLLILKIRKSLTSLIESTGEDGRLDIDKAKEVLQELRELPKSKSIPILRNYLKLVKEKERSYQCLIEKSSFQ